VQRIWNITNLDHRSHVKNINTCDAHVNVAVALLRRQSVGPIIGLWRRHSAHLHRAWPASPCVVQPGHIGNSSDLRSSYLRHG
jgi:hypothetical protein